MADINRSYFADQLADPLLRDRLFALTQAEVGGQGPDAQQAFLETVLNRAAARNLPLTDTMSRYVPSTGEGYYPSLGNTGALSDAQRTFYGNLLTRVMAGSDLTGGATGNASGTVGFAGGPMTARIGGEKFGIEGPDMRTPLPRFDTPGGLPMLAYDNPAPAMPNLPVLPPEIAQGTSVTPNQRVAGAFEALQGGVPAGAAPSGVPGARMTPVAAPTNGAPPMVPGEGGIGDFLRNNWLTIAALGGGIAKGGIGEGFTQAARIGALQAAGRGKESDDIREYQFAKAQGYSGTFEDWMKQKRAAGAPKTALQPIYDSEGNIWTLTNDGRLIKPQGAEGFKLSKGVEWRNYGTYQQAFDKVTGRAIGEPVPIDVAGKEAAEARGQGIGKAQLALPGVISTAEQSLKLVDDMLAHPGREMATGASGTFDPRNYFPGTDAYNFAVRSKQLEGRVFLDAFDQLRGGGAITEAEGTKATAAAARLDRRQSDEDYAAALKELQGLLRMGIERARRKAAGNLEPLPSGTTSQPQGNAPVPGNYTYDPQTRRMIQQ